MSDKRNVEKQKAVSSIKREWLIDLGLVLLYSVFLLCCFLLAIFHKDWGFWYGFVSTVLFSACIGYFHYNLNRTLKVFFLASILAIVLSFVPVAFLFQLPSRLMEISGSLYSQEVFWALIMH